jgi:hypothetical protein
MKNIITVLLISLFTILAQSAYAEIDQSQYQGTVAVTSQSPNDLQQAMPQALTQVLVKLSGNPDIAQSGKIKNQLKQATNMVQSYSYLTTPDPTNPHQTNLMLQVQFYQQAVDQLLQQAGATNVQTQGNNAAEQLTLHISNVGGLDDYANVLKYLRSLPAVNQVDASDINPNAVIVTLSVNGGIDALNKALATGTALQADTTNNDATNGNNTVYLRWIPPVATPASTNNINNANPNPSNNNPAPNQPSATTSSNTPSNNGIDMGA